MNSIYLTKREKIITVKDVTFAVATEEVAAITEMIFSFI